MNNVLKAPQLAGRKRLATIADRDATAGPRKALRWRDPLCSRHH